MLLGLFGVACSDRVSDEEFKRVFGSMNSKRLEFRKAFRDFGDSCQTHHFYTSEMLELALADSSIDQYFEPNYYSYHDSLRTQLAVKQMFFKKQWSDTRNVIKSLEEMDMRFDGIVEKIKTGKLSEKQGLDSLEKVSEKMQTIIAQIDSMQQKSRLAYWDFRKNNDEYQYNLNNLKALYRSKIYRQKSLK